MNASGDYAPVGNAEIVPLEVADEARRVNKPNEAAVVFGMFRVRRLYTPVGILYSVVVVINVTIRGHEPRIVDEVRARERRNYKE